MARLKQINHKIATRGPCIAKPKIRKRIRGRAGMRLRQQALERDGYLCQHCLPRIVPATEVDHIKPLFKGGEDTLQNRQSLCSACHEKKKAKERKDPAWTGRCW